MVSGTDQGSVPRRLRLGMVGGGRGAFIGAVHRIAARLDDRYDLVAGALSRDPANATASAADLHIAPDRAYADFRAAFLERYQITNQTVRHEQRERFLTRNRTP